MVYKFSSRPRLLALLALVLPSVQPFSFSYTAPTQCGDLTVNWEGGTAPFNLLITPAYAVPRNISIPSTAFSGNKGTFTTTLNVASQKQFLLTMSDASAFGSGGTSGLLTVGDPVNGATCSVVDPNIPFDFQLLSSLQQCRDYTISNFAGATSPVTIYGLIPLGTAFALYPQAGASSYSWKANARAGTSIIFTITNGLGQSGGSSDVVTVGNSDDNTCINSSSPASTVTNQPSSTGASATSSATSTQVANESSGSTSHTGAIVGAIVGVVVALLIVGTLTWFCVSRRRKAQDTPHTSTQFSKRTSRAPVDILPHEPTAALEGGSNYEPDPYVLPTGHSNNGQYPPSAGWYGDNQSVTTEQQRTGITNGSKFSEAFSSRTPNTPARFVLHTDAGEVAEPADENEVIELPPQYTTIGGKVVRSPTYREPSGSGSASTPPTGTGHSAGPSP